MKTKIRYLFPTGSPSNLTVFSPGNGTLILNWSLPASMLAPPLQLYAVEVRNQSNVVLYSTTMATPGPIPPLGCRNYTISVAPVCPTSKGTAAVYTFSSDLGMSTPCTTHAHTWHKCSNTHIVQLTSQMCTYNTHTHAHTHAHTHTHTHTHTNLNMLHMYLPMKKKIHSYILAVDSTNLEY